MKTKYKTYIGIILLLFLIGLAFAQNVYCLDKDCKNKEIIDDENLGKYISEDLAKDFLQATNSKIEKQGTNTIVTVNKGGTIKIDGAELKINTDLKNKFIFNEKGELIEGTLYKINEDSRVRIKGYEVPLPKDAEVIYEKDKVVIKLPLGSELRWPRIYGSRPKKEPEPIPPGIPLDEEILLEFKTKGVGGLKLESGETFQAIGDNKEKETNLFYDGEEFYFWEERAVIKNKEGKPEILLYNPNFADKNYKGDKKVYFGFESRRLDEEVLIEDIGGPKSYQRDKQHSIDVFKGRININSPDKRGIVVSLTSDNRFNIGITDKNTLFAEARNGRVIIERGEPNFEIKNGKLIFPEEIENPPRIRLSGESVIVSDKNSFQNTGEKLKFYPDKILIDGFEAGESYTPVIISRVGFNGEFLDRRDLILSGENEFDFKTIGRPIKGDIEGEKLPILPKVDYNKLTPEEQNIYSKLDRIDREEIQRISKEGGIAAIQSKLKDLKKRSIAPLRASIDIDGGSGTLIGFTEKGEPLVLSAAHVFNRVGSKDEVYLYDDASLLTSTQLRPDREKHAIKAEVIALSKRGADPKLRDLALLKLNPTESQLEEIKKRGFVKVAPTIDYLKEKDEILTIGCPSSRFYRDRCSAEKIKTTTGTDSLQVNLNFRSGQSGGGGFKNGYLVGIIHSGEFLGGDREYGGLANLRSIHSFLDENKFSYLYKFIMIFWMKQAEASIISINVITIEK